MWERAHELPKSALVIKWEIIFFAVLECISLSPRTIQFPPEETPISSLDEIPNCYHWLYKYWEWVREKARFDPSILRFGFQASFLLSTTSSNSNSTLFWGFVEQIAYLLLHKQSKMRASSIHFTSSVYIFWDFVQIAFLLRLPLILFVTGDLTLGQSWVFIGRYDVGAKTPILWPPDAKTNTLVIRKDPDAGKDWGQEEKGTTEDEMVGWHHRLNGHEFGWALGVGVGQGGLACCSSCGRKESDLTEQLNWLNWTVFFMSL